jgi:ABC-type bacteriocin/lantibiotic exporter with double-glycine peptidase domain
MIADVLSRDEIKEAAMRQKRAAAALHDVVNRTSGRRAPDRDSEAWREALCMLITALNPRCKTFKVTEAMPHNAPSFELSSLLDVMANLGYYARSERLRLSEVDQRLLPCLFIPDGAGAHPCVYLGAGRIYSARRKALARFPDKSAGGTFFFFEAYSEEKARTSKNVRAGTGFKWFRALITRFHTNLWCILLAGLVLNLIALAAPLFIMVVYDRVLSSGAADILPVLAAGAAMGAAIEWMLRGVRSRNLSWLAARMGNIVSNRIFGQLIHLAPGYIERASVPSQVARIKTFEAVRDFFSGSVFLSLLELPFMIIALAVIAVIAGPLVMVPLVVSVLYVVLFFAVWRYVRVSIRTAAKAGSARQQFLLETVNKMEPIRSSDLTLAWRKKFRDLSAREAVTSFRLAWLGMVGETLAQGLTILSAVAIIGFGVGMVWAGTLSTGALVATMILVWRVLGPFYSLCTMIPRLDQLRNSIRQVDRLMEIDTEQTAHRLSARLGKIRGRISFVNVGIRYSMESDPLLAGLSFEAMPGDIVAVTGSNGTGKSTVLKMIKGMYVPQAGSIRIDGFDLRQLDPVDLRRRIAYIPQETSFFRGTIAENLRFANPLVSDREMEIALGQAGVAEDIARLPDGLNTMIGHGGMVLSSSLELRLSMVRAYLHDAPILLVDELPNSLLSEQAGQFMKDNLLRHKKDRTTIIVTHREDFMNMADTIVVLRRGLPPQSGPRPFMMNEMKKQKIATKKA